MFSVHIVMKSNRILPVCLLLVTGLFIHAASELIRCRVCFGKISVNANACIHCGEPKFQPNLTTIEQDQLQDRNEVFYPVNGEEPFTGYVVEGRYTNGRPKARQEYKAGKRKGQRMKWYENGQVMQISFYADGELHGLMEEWYENGLKMAEGTYEKGKLHGLVRRWHNNGEREAEYPYEDGELHGILIQWSRHGRMTSKKQYETGKLKARLAIDAPPKKESDKAESQDATEPKPKDNQTKRFDDLKFP